MTEEKRLELLKQLERCGSGCDYDSDSGEEAWKMACDVASVLKDLLEALKEEK